MQNTWKCQDIHINLCCNSKYKIMSTAELEMKKARLARKILSEKDENIIVFLGENLRKMKRTAIDTQKREKLVTEFLNFAAHNYSTDTDFIFNRDECYER